MSDTAIKEQVQRPKEDVNPNSSKITVHNVSGSTAGSGSGDFHIYRNQRRKELDRLERIEKEGTKEEINREFMERREATRLEEAERTLKKAEKRKKKKQNKRHNEIRKKVEQQLQKIKGGDAPQHDDENDGEDDDAKEKEQS
ncbi:hypothetical protein SAMD00019534_093200 [Acytostelium subglobosum LB1]|uniref:hypothetical protein n=1 Tax=Acytostelium subglobosum LB1 TaxID=1410327 RepID=UPI000644FA00|nr:hypothetical protein SAMD00019534_093200 [Acytostelium subglobosum LB1]GAM26145.1 hypothetical protein SAMD00019534_093200 [Acytostelium subglobosum LB1]|eukprot:XP_012750699.1 hypothetical protein SAMD00019534_093200 [Acytostelium subglobosum LB1]